MKEPSLELPNEHDNSAQNYYAQLVTNVITEYDVMMIFSHINPKQTGEFDSDGSPKVVANQEESVRVTIPIKTAEQLLVSLKKLLEKNSIKKK